MSETKTDVMPLQVATPDALKRDLGLTAPPQANLATTTAVAGAPADDLDKRADEFVASILNADLTQVAEKESGRASVDTMAAETQKKAARMSEMLKEPIGTLSKRGSDQGEVGNALIQLKMKVEELDPSKVEFDSGWLSRVVGKIPGVGDPLKRYFTKYESAQTVIKAIMASLEKGRDQLLRDNQTLLDDQKEMWDATKRLEKAIALGQIVDRKLSEKSAAMADPEKKKFIDEELIFALRQRLIDLQQQLAVSQQGIVAMELIMRNNKELARGVNRALNVTMSALQVGVTVALALQKQKDVLEKVNAVSSTTSDLIAGTAARLKTQGADIQKQASSTMLNMDSLRTAFVDLNSALDDVSKFRSAALPQMAQTVIELDRLTGDAAKTLQRLEKGNQQRPVLEIE